MTCEDCIETHDAIEKAPDCAGCREVRPDVMAEAEKLLVEYDDVWRELAKS